MSYSLISSWMLICNAVNRLVCYILRRGEKKIGKEISPNISNCTRVENEHQFDTMGRDFPFQNWTGITFFFLKYIILSS